MFEYRLRGKGKYIFSVWQTDLLYYRNYNTASLVPILRKWWLWRIIECFDFNYINV